MSAHPELTELPFGTPGRVYRSPMPFGYRDPAGDLIQAYHTAGVSGVLVLAEAEECLAKIGFDLLAYYREQGFELLHFPIADFDIPQPEAMEGALAALEARARAGQHTAVHCYAGIGRTGTLLACLAIRLLNLDPGDAIRWVRRSIPGAVEVPEQVDFIYKFASNQGKA